MATSIITLAVIGFVLSVYSFYIEKRFERTPQKSVCDINDRVSCTKAFTSQWGKTFGVKNSVWGILLYIFVFGLTWFGFDKLLFYVSIFVVLSSIYLGYILLTRVKSVCLICFSVYTINILILIYSYLIVY
jgi:vitamin-K-epoxide reductase (warfarin-sensitive)